MAIGLLFQLVCTVTENKGVFSMKTVYRKNDVLLLLLWLQQEDVLREE